VKLHRWLLCWAVLGISVACVLYLLVGAVTDELVIVLWPSSLLLMAAEGVGPSKAAIIIVVAMAANGLRDLGIGAFLWVLKIVFEWLRQVVIS
jgi:hypothetical protein